VIRPGELVTLRLRYDAARRQLDFAYRNDTQPLATGTIDIPALARAAPDDRRLWRAGCA
jgi:hypothetical protein